jgi:Protein of unknown function (DUF1573)
MMLSKLTAGNGMGFLSPRKRWTVLLVIMAICSTPVGLVIGPRLWNRAATILPSVPAKESAPTLTIRQPVIDLGDGEPGQLLQGSIKLENTGSSLLTFTAQRSCGCTSLDPNRGTIASGGHAEIKVGVRLPEYSNSSRSVYVKITTNDPSMPDRQCTLLARSRASVDVSPGALYFGELNASEVGTVAKTLTVRDRFGKPIRDPQTVLVRSTSGNARYRWIKNQDETYSLSVLLAVPLRSGEELRDQLSIGLRATSSPFLVPVFASMREPITVIPSTLLLTQEESTNEPKTMYLWVRSMSPLGRMTVAAQPPGITVRESKDIRPGLRTIALTIAPVPRPRSSQLSLRFDNIPNALKLTVLSPQ